MKHPMVLRLKLQGMDKNFMFSLVSYQSDVAGKIIARFKTIKTHKSRNHYAQPLLA